jgi:hypothetical protein
LTLPGHGDAAREKTVLDFATALRLDGGLDADLDLWHLTDHENRTTYGRPLLDRLAIEPNETARPV